MEGNSSASLADVRLIVKSANQQFDDLIIHSEPTWTIRRLKAHLTQVYPSNPTVPEQKLIYSGQLLSDELILKDILRSYKDVETENHIFHLVYTPKMSLTKPKTKVQGQELQDQNKAETSAAVESSSTDGLRHRNVASSSSASPATETPVATTSATSNIGNLFTIPQMAAGCPNFGYPNMMQFSLPGQFSEEMIAQQQAAVYNWVQQVYSNYMDQCMRMANGTANTASMQPQAPSIPMFMAPPQFMPAPQLATASTSSIPTVDEPSTSGAALSGFAHRGVPIMPPTAAHQQQQQPPAVATDTTAVPPAAAPADNVEQPQPRFPNIVQEEQDNRDWLDSFYSITRLVALLTLVYFYSSPIRCLVVAIIAVGIYLYHIGFFQTRRRTQPNNININNNQNINDNNAAADNAEQEPLRPDAAPAAVGGEAAAPTPAADPITSSVTPPEAEPNATSLIAFIRTFVVSFFASLLPETPAL